MKEKNPDMVAGKKQKFVMRPPQVVRIGTKKTSFSNFTEVNIKNNIVIFRLKTWYRIKYNLFGSHIVL